MDVKKTGISLLKTSGKFAAGTAGLGLTVIGRNFVPASVPGWARASFTILAAYLGATTIGKDNDGKDNYIASLFHGVGAAGVLDLAKELTNGKAGILGTINSKLPNLSGIGNADMPAGKQLLMGLGNTYEKKLLGNTSIKRMLVS